MYSIQKPVLFTVALFLITKIGSNTNAYQVVVNYNKLEYPNNRDYPETKRNKLRRHATAKTKSQQHDSNEKQSTVVYKRLVECCVAFWKRKKLIKIRSAVARSWG